MEDRTSAEPLTQIIPVGKGILIAVPQKISDAVADNFKRVWEERLPDVPVIIMPQSQIVKINDDTLMFEFSGNPTPELVEDFRTWWDANRPGFKLGLPYSTTDDQLS